MKCDTPAGVWLVARARADPEAERDRAHAGDALGDDALARREFGQLVLRHVAGSYPSSESLRQSVSECEDWHVGELEQFVNRRAEMGCTVPRRVPPQGSGSPSRGVPTVGNSRWCA